MNPHVHTRSHLVVIADMISANVTGLLRTLIGDTSIIIVVHILSEETVSANMLFSDMLSD